MNSISPLQRLMINWLLILMTGWATLQVLHYFSELLSVFVTAGLVAFLLNYPVARLHRFLPRGVAVAVVYLMAGVGVAVLGLTVVPPVLNQARQLSTNLPSLLTSGQQQLSAFQTWSEAHNLPFDIEILTQQLLVKLQAQVEALTAQSLGLVVGTVNWLVDLILIVVISFYMLVDGDRVWRGLTSIFAEPIRNQLRDALQRNLQRFFSGQLLLGLFMALALTPLFWWLRVPFFLLFAVLIGLLEVIPVIGATLGITIVSTLVALINWWLALQVLGAAVAVQQVKDNLIAPRLMGNLTGLSPVFIFASLLLGAQFGGLLGVILAIPITGVVKSLLEIVVDPTLPPQTGAFFYNLWNPLPSTQEALNPAQQHSAPEPSTVNR